MNNCGLSLRALRFLRYNAMIVQVCGSQMMKFRFTDKKEKLCSSKGEIYDGKDRSDHWFSWFREDDVYQEVCAVSDGDRKSVV